MTFAWNPPTGLNDTSQFPDEDSSIRSHIQNLLQQVPDYVDTYMAKKAQENWIAPTLLNSWVNFGSPYANASYMKDDFGFVHIKGLIKSGTTTSGTPILVLPTGYRPPDNQYFAVTCSNGTSDLFTTLRIDFQGNVTTSTSTQNTWLSLNIAPFRAG